MSQPDLHGKVFGNYRIDARLGMGGMGTVYRARHLHLDRVVAIKILHAHLAADPSFRARFQREARAVSVLDHPNVVRLLDFGDADGELYLVMELLTDGSLRTLLNGQVAPASGWSPEVGIDLVRQAADGLAYAHERGMVHRDIKPDNLLLLSTPEAERPYIGKLADFGLARLGEGGGMTASGVTLGTPTYMSPEQCQGGPVDRRSDIYALGVVLYEMTAGRPPFRMRTLSDAIYNHVYVAPPPPRLFRPSLSLEIERVILRCLAKHPGDRYQSMDEFIESLDDAISASPPVLPTLPVEAAEPSTGDAQSLTVFAPDARTPMPVPTMTPSVPEVAAPSIDSGGSRVPSIVVFGPTGDAIETAALAGDGLTVGRLADNHLVLDDPRVSRHHLLVDWDGSRALVTDIGSSTGTHIGGVRIPAHVPHPWNAAETLRIGDVQLRLVLPAVTTAARDDHERAATTDQSQPPLEATSMAHGRRRWLVPAGVAMLVLVISAGLFLSRGGDDDPGLVDATSTSQIAASGDRMETSTAESPAIDTGTQAALSSAAAPQSTDAATIVDPSGTVVLPTTIPTPETPEGWISVTAADPLVSLLIGESVGETTVVRLPFQEFERGMIISLPPEIAGGGMIVALTNENDYETGIFTRYDPANFTVPESDTPEATPPAGYYVPAQPFRAIWHAVPGLSDAIGWATYDEPGDRILYQQFDRGLILALEDTYRTWVFYGDLALDTPRPWRSFSNDIEVLDETTVNGLRQIARVAALPEVASQLGVALSPAEPVRIPYQTFGDGLMFLTEMQGTGDSDAAGLVVSLVADVSDELGSWRQDPLVIEVLDADVTPLGEPPDGMYAPAFPFDRVLASDPELAAELGWPNNPYVDSTAALQQFERGIILWFAYAYRSWVILGDRIADETGSWISYGDE